MAIFKPTNRKPFFTTFDLQDVQTNKPYFFECTIDSSNIVSIESQTQIKVDEYAITIYDENNEQIFPTDGKSAFNNRTKIIDLSTYCKSLLPNQTIERINTGVNGTKLMIPFIVDAKDAIAGSTVSKNQISINERILSNGKTYSWVITLFQGIEEEGQTQVHEKYYDMIVSRGEILGSINTRIHAKKTNKIMANQFIQLLDQDDKPIGSRVRITSYDQSFGYIYPQIGAEGIEEKFVKQDSKERAVKFKVYKYGKNPQNLAVTQKVDNICQYPIGEVTFDKATKTITVKVPDNEVIAAEGSTGNPNVTIDETGGYGSWTISVKKDEKTMGFSPTSEESVVKIQVDLSSRILFNYNGGSGVSDTKFSQPYNGVYYLAEPPKTSTEENKSYVCYVWARTSDANTWSGLINKEVYVPGAAEMYSCKKTNSSSGSKYEGTINETPVIFDVEDPIPLYVEKEGQQEIEKSVGEILYNKKTGIDEAVVYIRPQSAVTPRMLLQIDKQQYDIISIDKDLWEVTIKPRSSGELQLPQTKQKYLIKSNYRSSDDNVFHLAAKPAITIHVKDDLEQIEFDPKAVVEYGNIHVSADYVQQDAAPWKNFQWLLLDEYNRELSHSPIKYAGYIEHTFYGLEDKKTYAIRVIIEGQDGNVYTAQRLINIKITYDSDGSIKWIRNIAQNCKTTGVNLSYLSPSFILPVKTEEGKETITKYNDDNNNTDPIIAGVTYEDHKMLVDRNSSDNINQEGVRYKYTTHTVKPSGIGAASLITANLKKPLYLQGQFAINTENYTGEIVGLSCGDDQYFSLFIAPPLLHDCTSSTGFVLNDARINPIQWFKGSKNDFQQLFNKSIAEDKDKVSVYKEISCEKQMWLPLYFPKQEDEKTKLYAPIDQIWIKNENNTYELIHGAIYGPALFKEKTVFPLLSRDSDAVKYNNFMSKREAMPDKCAQFELADKSNLQLFYYGNCMWTDYEVEYKNAVISTPGNKNPDKVEDAEQTAIKTMKLPILNLCNPLKWPFAEKTEEMVEWRDGDSYYGKTYEAVKHEFDTSSLHAFSINPEKKSLNGAVIQIDARFDTSEETGMGKCTVKLKQLNKQEEGKK